MTDWLDAKRRVAAPLAQWAERAPGEQDRTVIVRASALATLDDALRDLDSLGVRVESAGVGVIVAVMTPPVLRLAAALPWVIAIEAPTTFQPSQ